jgi:transcriptional regulator with XRE-family HTH domain
VIFGEKIRQLREARGLKQTGLAKLAGVSQPTIAAIEKGNQHSSKYLPRLARALGVEISELDPDYPAEVLRQSLMHAAAMTAFEIMLEALRPDLSKDDRQSLARVFLDLALEPPDEKISLSLADQMRLRVQISIRTHRPKP